ncbi:MAG: tRNA (adenosine(37)-N6)-dimethylallyltransferase MiaA [Cytophagaceae bacterium]
MSQVSKKYLVCVVGPTAVGKTKLAIDLAKHFSTDVLSADSRQIYKELAIGTAKPTLEEMEGVTHHFIDSHYLSDEFSAGIFEREGNSLLESLFAKHDVVVLCGGTGLYVQALLYGMDEVPKVDESYRTLLTQELEEKGITSLQEELLKVDPETFHSMDIQNPQRVIRALEVYRATGNPISAYRTGAKKERPYQSILIGLERDREELYSRIDQRMDIMLDLGLEKEAELYYSQRHLNALQTVGYREIYDKMDGLYDRDEMVRLLKRNSRHYAKRQMTWFTKMEGIKWFHPNQWNEVKEYIKKSMQ